RMFRASVTPERDAIFQVDQDGGTLQVHAEKTTASSRPYLVHNGVVLPAVGVAWLGHARFLADLTERTSFELAQVEPGEYSLCVMQSGRDVPTQCQAVTFAAHGSLSLNATATK